MRGEYWLVETKAPNQQAHTDATDGPPRPVPGVQLLAEPIAFVVWPEYGDPNPVPGVGHPQVYHGRAQLDVVPDGNFANVTNLVSRCIPGGNGASRPVACVNPTGYLMLVKDAAPAKLPFTGGVWLGALAAGGAIVLVAAVAGILWWRRRQTELATGPPHPGGELN